MAYVILCTKIFQELQSCYRTFMHQAAQGMILSCMCHDNVVSHKLITAGVHGLLHYCQALLKYREEFAQADVIRVHVSPEHLKEHAADKLEGPGEATATSFDHQLVAPVLPWKVSEEEVRSGLADYGSHHVLHLT